MILALLVDWWRSFGHTPAGVLAQYWADDDLYGATFDWRRHPAYGGRVHIELDAPLTTHTNWTDKESHQ